MRWSTKQRNLWGAIPLAIGAALAMVGPVCGLGSAKLGVLQIRKVREERFPASILALDLAAKSNLAAVALSDGQVRVWRIDSGQPVQNFVYPQPDSELRKSTEVEPIRVRFSPDAKLLAVSHVSRVHLYDTESWQEVISLGVAGEDRVRPLPVPALARRPAHEEERTAQQMHEDYMKMYQDYMKKMAAGDGATRITDFAFTPDGSAILAAYCRGAYYDDPGFFGVLHPSGADPVRLWAVASGSLMWERVNAQALVVERVVLSRDGTLFGATTGRCAVQIHQLKNGDPLYSIRHTPPCLGGKPIIVFTSDGKQVITFSASPANKKFRPWEHLALYDAKDGTKVADFPGRIGGSAAEISPDGRWLATPTPNQITFKIYDVQTRKVAAVERWHFPWGWRGPAVDGIRFSPGGEYLVVASEKAGRLAVYQIGS